MGTNGLVGVDEVQSAVPSEHVDDDHLLGGQPISLSHQSVSTICSQA